MKSYYPFVSEEAKEKYTEIYHKTEEEYWPAPFSRVYVETPFGPTYVRVSGKEGAPAMVLLPCITAPSLSWSPNVRVWGKYFRIYAVDMINDYGLSVDRRHPLTRHDLIVWLDSVAEQLKLRKFILVGMSYGGWLTAEYALAFREKLLAIVMIAPGATILPISRRFLFRVALTGLFPIWGSHRLFRWLFKDSLNHPPKYGISYDWFMERSDLRFRSFRRRFVVPLRVLKDAEWKKITVPSLFMAGENEKLYPARKALEEMKRKSPQTERVLIPGAGHDLTALQADLVNEKVLAFLEKHLGPLEK